MARSPDSADPALSAASIAAHRFGLGEATLAVVGSDPKAWLSSQIGPADAQRGTRLPTLGDGLRSHQLFQQTLRQRREPAAPAMDGGDPAGPTPDVRSGEQQFADHFRDLVQADLRAHLATAATTTRPFAERLALFWANHFTVSLAKANTRALVGTFERDAIRPHIAGSFETLLKAAVTHGTMLRYLDNDQSAGPNSRVVQLRARRAQAAGEGRPRLTGLNENLARELLELHTLGAASKAYTQADVTALAAVLTGWRPPPSAAAAAPALFAAHHPHHPYHPQRPTTASRASTVPGTSRARSCCSASATPKAPTHWMPCCTTWCATRRQRTSSR